jgi:hypothetical protein
VPDAPDYTLLSDVTVIGGVTLNVNVVGSVTINVNVVNTSLDIRIVAQTVGIQLISAYQVLLNKYKIFWAEDVLSGGGEFGTPWVTTLLDYTTPSTTHLLIESMSFNLVPRGTVTWANIYGTTSFKLIFYTADTVADFRVMIDNNVVARFTVSKGNTSVVYVPSTPLRLSAGSRLRILGTSTPAGAWAAISVIGYEVPAA